MSDRTVKKSSFDKSRRPFLLRKLHSLSGVFPVGVFILFHFWTNAKALQGQRLYDDAVADITRTPYLVLFEAAILLPLAFHAGYGVFLALSGRSNVSRYANNRNWMYTLQRTTGLIALVFILLHLSQYWWPKVTKTMVPDQFYPALSADLSSTTAGFPLVALGYLLGVAAVSFHFANGLWGFLVSWGITVTRRSQRTSAAVLGVFGLTLFLFGANTVIYFATGSRLALSETFVGEAQAAPRLCADRAPALSNPEL